MSCKPIHQVSLYQLRFFPPECSFKTIVSSSILSSGLHSSLLNTRYTGKTSLTTIIVLFFLMEMVTKETHQIPVQSRPFPVYPGWQVQTYNPLVFMQIAFTWQEWFPLHSSISEKPSMHFCTLSFFVTYSRSIPLIIINFKTNVSLLGLHNIFIYIYNYISAQIV